MRGSPIGLLAAAAVAAGCGSTSSPPQSDARGSLDTFLATCAEARPRLALPTLQPAAQGLLIAARNPAAGCGAVLGVGAATGLTAADFDRPPVRFVSFDGATTHFDVTIAGVPRRATLSFGTGGWRLEAPGS